MSDIYKEIILDHFRNPRNFGFLSKPSFSVHVDNPLCGDELTMQTVFKNSKIVDVKFEGQGCAISQSSASMLTEYIKGKEVSALIKLDQKFMIKLLGIEVSHSRIKCLLLPLEALRKICNQKIQKIPLVQSE